MNYKKYNDYELIYLIRENDNESYNILFNKYLPIMKSIAFNYYKKYMSYGFDYDDFKQESYIAFCGAVNSFDESKNSLFYTFAVLCINRALLSYCRKISCEKKNINNNYLVDIDEVVVCEDSNIDSYFISEDKKQLIDNIKFKMDFIDSCVFELRYNGFSYREISLLLDLPLRTVQFKGRKARKYYNSQYVL